MREVACRVLWMHLEIAAKRGASLEDFVRGLPVTVAQLKNGRERIDWETYCTLCERLEGICGGPEDLERDSTLFAQSPELTSTKSAFGLLFSSRALYWAGHRWFGHAMFTIVKSELDDLPLGAIRMTLSIPPDRADCAAFFRINAGVYRAMPRTLGQPDALVEYELFPRKGVYTIQPAPSLTLFARLRRASRILLGATTAFGELGEQQKQLKARFDELNVAHTRIGLQAEQLKTVNVMGRELTQHTELASFGAAVSKLLLDRFKCSGVLLSTLDEANESRKVFEAGVTTGEPQAFGLATAGKPIGRLQLWGLKAQGQDPDAKLLADLIPLFSIALDNARSFSMLREHQQHLEARVEERTVDLKRTTDQLQEALGQQKELDKQKTQFFANASHELRTPLTLLVGPLETLSNSENLPEPARLELATSLRNGYRMIKLVNDLLDLSKIEAGKMSLRMGPTDLARLLEESVRPWRPALTKRGIRLELLLPKTLPLVADAERLEQVILNLVSNAVKYTPDNGFLRVQADRDGERLRFAVENSGEGVDPEDAAQVFERFGQSMRSRGRRFGSTGLGLAVVREIVELHGGTVTLDNRPGESVAFRVELPVGAAPDEAALVSVPSPSRQEVTQYLAAANNESYTRIEPTAPVTGDRSLLLIVEDNPDLRGFLVRGLSPDFEIIEAANGAEGLELAKKRAPNLILSDVMMPIMDGLEMCKQLKADLATQGTPLVFLTARSDLEVKLTGLQGGADDFVVKPFHLEEVRARLHTQLRLRQLAVRLSQAEKLGALGILVGGVAHEVRNPLNGIINALRPLLEMVPDDGSGAHDLIKTALEAAERVDSLSAQLLAQGRAGEGAKGPVNLGDNVAFALRMLAHKTEEGPQIVCDLQKETPVTVIGESGALNQIWVNLIDNAIQAAGPKGKVTVSLRGTPESAQIDVTDDGAGISADVMPKIFDPFFTTREIGKGTGLGLALVREIVHKHGGTIAVQSQPGAGARFRVTLPSGTLGAPHARG